MAFLNLSSDLSSLNDLVRGKVCTPTPALVDYFHFDLLFSLQPGDDDFKKTIFKLSDESGHLELEDQGIFSKGKLDSNDGKEMLLFKLVS